MRQVTWLLVAIATVACSEGDPRGVVHEDPFEGGALIEAQAAMERDFAAARGEDLARQPVFAATAPPPITGGTLAVSRDGERAVVADPDRDELWVLALPSGSILSHHELADRAEPGRVIEDEHGDFHVALRGDGDIVSLTRDGALRERRAACAAPRGLAIDGETLHVACAEGLLVSFVASGGPRTRVIELEPDLRDVVVDEGSGLLAVSLFRAAEVLFIDADGVVVARHRPPTHANRAGDRFAPNVAWRMRAAPGGGVLMLHQRSQTTPVSIDADASYAGSACSVGVVQAVLSLITRDGEPVASPAITALALAVDFDVVGDRAVVVAPGILQTPRAGVVTRAMHQVRYLDVDEATREAEPGSCVTGPSLTGGDFETQLTAVAKHPDGSWLFQGREPAIVVRDETTLTRLPTGSVADDGHAFFHNRPGVAIACASCHPEGGEDGHTWRFEGVGARRTQTLRGPIMDSAPFHWGGDVPDFAQLAHSTIERMGGPEMHVTAVSGMARYVEAIPHLPRVAGDDPQAVARGAALFSSMETGCTDCHSGPRLSDDRTVDVGTGQALQVPGLRGLRYRAPFLHDGCAESLYDVLDRCGTDRHGDVAHLSADEIDDLVTYLESL